MKSRQEDGIDKQEEVMVQREYRYEEVLGGLGVKDSVLSLLWLGLNPWPRNFCMPQVQPKKKKEETPVATLDVGCWNSTDKLYLLSICLMTLRPAALSFQDHLREKQCPLLPQHSCEEAPLGLFSLSFYGYTCVIWKFPGRGRIGAASVTLAAVYGAAKSDP